MQVNYATGCADIKCTTNDGFASAVASAKMSDFVIYVGGISSAIEGEGNDRSNISLPGLQSDLISMYVIVVPLVVTCKYFNDSASDHRSPFPLCGLRFEHNAMLLSSLVKSIDVSLSLAGWWR